MSNRNTKKVVNNKKKEPSPLRPECKTMCPKDEVDLRVENNLVHALEKLTINSKTEYKMVKEYSRPAADKYIKSEHLRTVDALMNTTLYLIKDVYRREQTDYLVRYEFIFDRLRAIRQDMIIQRCRDEKCMRILEIILRFYLLSDYKLFSTKNYDEYINSCHLKEVLSFIIYDETCKKRRAYFLSAYLLLNLDNSQVLTNIFKSSKNIKSEFPLNRCLKLCKSYLNRNFVLVFNIYKELPLFCQLALHRKLSILENEMIKIMSWAYGFKNVSYPVENLFKISTIRNVSALQRFVDAKLVRLESDTQSILFTKSNSNTTIKNERDYVDSIDEKLAKTNEIDFILENLVL